MRKNMRHHKHSRLPFKGGKSIMADGICKHCRHRKTKLLQGKIVSDYCKKYGNPLCFPECYTCNGFNRSIKSILRLIGA